MSGFFFTSFRCRWNCSESETIANRNDRHREVSCGLESGIWGGGCGSGWQQQQQYVQTEVDNDWMDGTCTNEMDGWIDG